MSQESWKEKKPTVIVGDIDEVRFGVIPKPPLNDEEKVKVFLVVATAFCACPTRLYLDWEIRTFKISFSKILKLVDKELPRINEGFKLPPSATWDASNISMWSKEGTFCFEYTRQQPAP